MTHKRILSVTTDHRQMIWALFLVSWSAGMGAIKIDNQLVASPNDCFVRIALGAMMPFENTFRNTDTNLLKNCEELCSSEGQKCQTFAFGIHVRGNGTCQLSSQKMFATKTRPAGTIFDPDFDIYSRKENCLPSSNSQEPPFPGGLESGQPPSTFPTGTTGGETIDPGTGTTAVDGGDDKFTSTPNFPTTFHPNSPHGNRYPATERYPPPPSSNGAYDRYPSHRDPYNSGRPEPSSGGYGPSLSGGDGYYDNSPLPGNNYASAARPGDRDHNNNYNSDNRYNQNHNRPAPYDRNYPAPNYYPGPPSNSYSNSKYPPYSSGGDRGGSSTYEGGTSEGTSYQRPSPTGGNWFAATEDSRYHKEKSDGGNSYYGNRPTPPTASRPDYSSSEASYSSGGYHSSPSQPPYHPPPTNKYPERPSYGGGESDYRGQSPRPSNPLYPGGSLSSENQSYGSSGSHKYPDQKPIRPPPTDNNYGGTDPNRPDPSHVASTSYPSPQPPAINNYGPTQTPPPGNSNKYPNQSPPTGNNYNSGGYSDRNRNRPAPSGPTNNNYYVTEDADKYKQPQPPPTAGGHQQPKQPPPEGPKGNCK